MKVETKLLKMMGKNVFKQELPTDNRAFW